MSETKMPKVLFEHLSQNPAVLAMDKDRGTLPLSSLMQEALILSTSYLKNPRPILVVKKNLYAAQRLYERLASVLEQGQCALFPSDESLRVEAIAASPEMRAGKVETLAALIDNPNQIVVCCPAGLLRLLPMRDDFAKGCIKLQNGMTMNMNALKNALLESGYQQVSHIDQPLTFAQRGGIIDVYSINYDRPIRVEFFDDEIDRICFFDVETQKTIGTAPSVQLVPATDLLFTQEQVEEIRTEAEHILKERNDVLMSENVHSDLMLLEHGLRDARLYPYSSLCKDRCGIWDYMNHPVIVYSDKEAIEQSRRKLVEESVVYLQEMVQEQKFLPRFAVFNERIAPGLKEVVEDPFADRISGLEEVHLPQLPLNEKIRLVHGTVLACLTEQEVERVLQACVQEKINYHLVTDGTIEKDTWNILLNPLMEGFRDPIADLTVVTSQDLFEVHHHEGRYEKKFRNAEIIHGFEELEPGDYVVHAQYGVGQYMGIETRQVQGTTRDFLKVIYRGNAELFVPLEQFRLVRKFVSREGVVPRLNKLGGNEWQKTREKLAANVDDIAERLVTLYADRREHIGHAFEKDSELQLQFESEFEYELTPDQKKAVEDVKRDMETDKPMDRLVCGDVGFGKTEIAIRASFKAAAENKQVAVLCPTTVLAEQHFRTFSKRFEGYPFTIRVLDRFVKPEEVKRVLEEVKSGRCDILIGTHRILSKDIVFKDLGLLVVDEEQRFGVEHKEKIKEFKNSVDVLTLSATPIPRTLQMSLVGIRSLSQLETPPNNRYSVQTYVVEKNRGLVTDAIEKELSRDGQVFFLHNNIETIYNTARTIQALIPDARVSVVHGQLDRETVEDEMLRFYRHETNVLVCTTIVENGIDVPNANTILVDNAQDFGLSQIYQIKGRVGRSDRVAYAYLMIPLRKQLSEVASKRLSAVKEFASLGSGYKIAMRDLTIRGAGDLLGPHQSGFIDTVGIDMYMEMLQEAIEKKRGEHVEKKEPVKPIMLSKSGYIPQQFAPDDFDKISMYQRIDALDTLEDLEEYKKDVCDQYGRLPSEVAGLFEKHRLDVLAKGIEVESCKEVRGNIEITFTKEFSQNVDGVKLFKLFSDLNKDIALRYTHNQIIATIPRSEKNVELAGSCIIEASKARRVA